MSRDIRKGDSEGGPLVSGSLGITITIDPESFGPIGVHSSDGLKVRLEKKTTYRALWMANTSGAAKLFADVCRAYGYKIPRRKNVNR
jgi:hypothetical protein